MSIQKNKKYFLKCIDISKIKYYNEVTHQGGGDNMTAQDKKIAKKDVDRLEKDTRWRKATPEQKCRAIDVAVAFLAGCQSQQKKAS